MHVLFGLYIWEWFMSIEFDWDFIRGKRKFRWPMTFYFLNRYCLLFALIGITIALNITKKIDCQKLYTFNSCTGNMAIGLASINLSLRTMAVWSQKLYIVIPLVAIILGHWSLLLHGVLLKAKWVDGEGCLITATDHRLLGITFIYTMTFDFIVLLLTGWKLMITTGARSHLVKLVFGDGLIFFMIAFLANLIATIFMHLNLNPVMSIIANVPAAIASTIVACRAVRRLNNFATQGPEIFSSSVHGNSVNFRTAMTSVGRPKTQEGVRVQMETFESPSDRSLVTYDASGKPVEKDSYDAEAQAISDEFKRPPY